MPSLKNGMPKRKHWKNSCPSAPMSCFDIQDKIILYDLTNTYFEDRKQGSKLAKFGRINEK